MPEETDRLAKIAFPKGTIYMTMRDELGVIFEDEDFAHLFPRSGQLAMASWRLSLLTIMQFAEGLSNRQAAEAVRARIDCKYTLSWSSAILASTLRSCASSGSACWRAVPRSCSSTIYSTDSGRWDS